MNKFEGPEDPAYKLVVGRIKHILEKRSLLEEADVCIREKCYILNNLQIERLSGKTLSMDRCYINLALVRQPGGNTDRPEGGDIADHSSQFSLLARLKVDTDEKGQLELSTIFSPSKEHTGTKQPRRILIQGRAGVGKTTLCKKLVHDFIHHRLWEGVFDRVLWVPLRKLKGRHAQGYSLENLFIDEYFSQHGQSQLLAETMRHAIDLEGGRTLFILDGLDEVSQHLDPDDDMFPFLQGLLNQPSVIITSRPYGVLATSLHPLDLQLETIGFYPNQVKLYLEKAFTDPESATKIQSFLQDHWLIQGLVRIPIQLDALCFAWDDGFAPGSQTMTAVYQAIEQRLWKKDVLRLEKQHEGKPLTKFDLRDSPPTEISAFVAAEARFLEYFAFTGLQNDVIDFETKHRDTIFRQLHPPGRGTDLVLHKMLPRLSFLRTSEPSQSDSNRTYHFLHLTYQEYFAARYFARQWNSQQPLECLGLDTGEVESVDPARFLREHKYATRYDIFWRFVAGLLGENQMPRFFETIDSEPVDLLGPAHQRLAMHCLSEVGHSKDTQTLIRLRTNLEQKLSRWLLFECEFRGTASLLSEMDFPEQVICDVFQQGSDGIKIKMVEPLSVRPSNPLGIIKLVGAWLEDPMFYFGRMPTTTCLCFEVLGKHSALPDDILTAVAERLKHDSRRVQNGAFKVLDKQSALPEKIREAIRTWHLGGATKRYWDAISALPEPLIYKNVVERLRHGNFDISDFPYVLPENVSTAIAACLGGPHSWRTRNHARMALTGRRNLPLMTLKAIAAWFEDQDENIRFYAVDALSGHLPALPEEIAVALAARLDDTAPEVRRAACSTLGSYQGRLPDDVLTTIAARFEDKDADVRTGAVKALRGQSALSEKILEAVAARLVDWEETEVANAAVEVICNQSAAPKEMLDTIATSTSWCISDDTLVAFSKQLALPERILNRLAFNLSPRLRYDDIRDYDPSKRNFFIFKAFRNQLSLPLRAVEEVVKWFSSDSYNEDMTVTVLELLSKQSTLPERVLKFVASFLESEIPAVCDRADGVLRRHRDFYLTLIWRYLKFLYGIWLRRSFVDQLSLHLEGNGFCIDMPEGRYRIDFACEEELENLMGPRAAILGGKGLDSKC